LSVRFSNAERSGRARFSSEFVIVATRRVWISIFLLQHLFFQDHARGDVVEGHHTRSVAPLGGDRR